MAHLSCLILFFLSHWIPTAIASHPSQLPPTPPILWSALPQKFSLRNYSGESWRCIRGPYVTGFHVGDQNTSNKKHPAYTARDRNPHTICKTRKCSMNKKKKIINTTMQLCICIDTYILYWVQQCSPKFMSTQNL